jgi:hypothetical protein
MPAVSRETIDRAVMDGISVVEIPGAHARPAVLVPRDEVALALRLHLATFVKHAASYFRSSGISETAFNGVTTQVCRALDEGPLPSSEIRSRLTHRDAGLLMTGALSGLAVRGAIRRFPADGRLDSAKYLYELRHPDDRPNLEAEGTAGEVITKACALFLRRHGPATLDELTWWGGFTKREARTALTALDAVPCSLPGWASEAWLLPDEARGWMSFTGTVDAGAVLLPYRDPFVQARRGPAILARDHASPVLDGTLQRERIGEVGGLNHHAIVAGGELVGIWEYDPGARCVVTRLWRSDAALRRRVAAAAADTEHFIREQLGDAKLSAVDPPAQRAKRLAFCRRPEKRREPGS